MIMIGVIFSSSWCCVSAPKGCWVSRDVVVPWVEMPEEQSDPQAVSSSSMDVKVEQQTEPQRCSPSHRDHERRQAGGCAVSGVVTGAVGGVVTGAVGGVVTGAVGGVVTGAVGGVVTGAVGGVVTGAVGGVVTGAVGGVVTGAVGGVVTGAVGGVVTGAVGARDSCRGGPAGMWLTGKPGFKYSYENIDSEKFMKAEALSPVCSAPWHVKHEPMEVHHGT